MKKVQLILNYAGYCFANEMHAIQGGKNRNVKFNALFGLIQHPEQGWILIDTGYATRFYEVTKSFPNLIYSKITKVHVRPEDEVKFKLARLGLKHTDIKHIIVTHFHADHIGGLKDFENASFYCSRLAYQQMKKTPALLGVTKGILKGLIPSDFESRVKLIEDVSVKSFDDIFGYKYDLLGDNSIIIYDLPGHAAGQLGVRLQTINQEYFLISDACWFKKSFEDLVPAHPIVRLFFDSWKSYISSLEKIHKFYIQNSEVIIVPTHCNESTSKLVSDKYDIDAL